MASHTLITFKSYNVSKHSSHLSNPCNQNIQVMHSGHTFNTFNSCIQSLRSNHFVTFMRTPPREQDTGISYPGFLKIWRVGMDRGSLLLSFSHIRVRQSTMQNIIKQYHIPIQIIFPPTNHPPSPPRHFTHSNSFSPSHLLHTILSAPYPSHYLVRAIPFSLSWPRHLDRVISFALSYPRHLLLNILLALSVASKKNIYI